MSKPVALTDDDFTRIERACVEYIAHRAGVAVNKEEAISDIDSKIEKALQDTSISLMEKERKSMSGMCKQIDDKLANIEKTLYPFDDKLLSEASPPVISTNILIFSLPAYLECVSFYVI